MEERGDPSPHTNLIIGPTTGRTCCSAWNGSAGKEKKTEAATQIGGEHQKIDLLSKDLGRRQ
jgi:hypothetical protein